MNVKSWPIFAGMESARTLRRAISVRVATASKKQEAYVLVRFISNLIQSAQVVLQINRPVNDSIMVVQCLQYLSRHNTLRKL